MVGVATEAPLCTVAARVTSAHPMAWSCPEESPGPLSFIVPAGCVSAGGIVLGMSLFANAPGPPEEGAGSRTDWLWASVASALRAGSERADARSREIAWSPMDDVAKKLLLPSPPPDGARVSRNV